MDEFAKNIAILQSICAIVSVFVLILSAVLILRQVSIAARSLAFESILKLQALVDSFLHDRQGIFSFMTVDCIVRESQFSTSVPSKDRPCKLTSQEHGRIALTEAQRAALEVLSQEEVQTVRRVIGKLNDLAQLLEDGLIDERVFLSKYHMMALRLIHAVEGVRRMIYLYL